MSATEAGQIVSEFSCGIAQMEEYRFEVRFDKPEHPALYTDEPVPLGKGTGPNTSRILAAAIGDCLSASLLFCARKARVPIRPIRTRVTTRLARNNSNRLRIHDIAVSIIPALTRVNSHDVCRSLKTTVSSRKACARASTSRWRSTAT